ncbi:hypothetical protein D1872_211620 [compost metagenome]
MSYTLLPVVPLGSHLNFIPAICGNLPGKSDSLAPLIPFSSPSFSCCPVTSSTNSVFPNGITVRSSPIVISPGSMEARIPPPFISAISAFFNCLALASMPSAIRFPRFVSLERTFWRSPSSLTEAVPITCLLSSSSSALYGSSISLATASSATLLFTVIN